MKISFVSKTAVLITLAFVTPSFADEYHDLCEADPTSPLTHQRKEQCDAVKEAKKAKTAHTVGVLMWGAATAACGIACGDITQTSSTWCSHLNIAATVAEIGSAALIQKDKAALTEAAASVGSTFAFGSFGYYDTSVLQKDIGIAQKLGVDYKATDADKKQIKTENKEAHDAACKNAVLSGIKTGLNGFQAKMDQKSISENLKNIKKLKSKAPEFGAPILQAADTARDITTAQSGSVGAGSLQKKDPATCSKEQKTGGSGAEFVSCAIALDPGLRSFGDPKFLDDFKKATGANLGDFVAGMPEGASAGQVLGAALGLKDGTTAEKIAAFSQAEAQIAANHEAEGSYSVGGLAASSNEKEEDMGSVMKDLFGKLLPQEEQAAKSTDVTETEYLLSKMDAKDVSNDKSISIFARVSFRYKQSQNRLSIRSIASEERQK